MRIVLYIDLLASYILFSSNPVLVQISEIGKNVTGLRISTVQGQK